MPIRLPTPLCLMTAVVLWLAAAPAQARDDLVFRAQEDCTAFRIRRGGALDRAAFGIRLQPGEDYPVIEQLDFDELVAIEVNRLALAVEEGCGRIIDLDSDFDRTSRLDVAALQEGPFFDFRSDPPPDPTPFPPFVSPFGERLLALCGQWGDEVDRRDFVHLLEEEESAQPVLARLDERLQGDLAGSPVPSFRYAERLGQLWFDGDAFRHVFCGEPRERSIGGLHWAARIYQAQQNEWALRVATNTETIEPPIYSVGVLGRAERPFACLKCRTSYNLDWQAEDLLIELTAAAGRALDEGGRNAGLCMFEQGDRRIVAETFGIAVVIRGRDLITAYPVTDPENYRCNESGCGCQFTGPRASCQRRCFRLPGED